MITCGLCGQQTKPGENTFRVVTEWREKTYPRREKANRFRKDRKMETSDDPGGVGYEIAKEVGACGDCYRGVQETLEQQEQEQEQSTW